MTDAPALHDCVALVVGGARGLGRGISEALSSAGAQVAVGDPDEPEDLPDGARFFAGDGSDPAGADDLVTAVADHHGHLDIVVNDIGGSPEAEAAEIVTLNLLAPLFVATAANRVMQAQEPGGAIVNLGSVGGIQPSPGAAAYGAAKAGLIHLTRSLAAEWGPKVRVNCVSPGVVAAEPSALGEEVVAHLGGAVALDRLGSPDDLAAAVLWLASPAAAYVSGANLVVHGGGERPAFLAAVAGP